MRSLRSRIIGLSALVALGSALICALAAAYVAQRTLGEVEEQQARAAVVSFEHRLGQLLDDLAFEANDYGNWDELYQQMPTPAGDWARINLTPGRVRGALTHYFITADTRRITGRFHDGDVRGPASTPTDPIPAQALEGLLGPPRPFSGLGAFVGHPALYAITPVYRSDRQGEPRGRLIALTYLNDEVRERLQPEGWSLRLDVLAAGTTTPLAGPFVVAPPHLHKDGDRLLASATLTTHDGRLAVQLSTTRSTYLHIGRATTLAIVLAGMVVAVLATLLGVWLGWRWVAPITALAVACRQQADDPHLSLPVGTGLQEADVLSESLRHLVLRLRVGQEQLAQALDRQTATNAIHRRFLAQLGHEFGGPIRRIIALCERMDQRGGHLTPEEVASAKQLADELEERFREILGLVERDPAASQVNIPHAMDAYLVGIADLLRPQATRAGVTIHVDAPADSVPLDPALLGPVLVNLGNNAIKASRPGGSLWLRGALDQPDRTMVWTVRDNGGGLPETLADRLRDAFTRGEVIPGTPGIGMGLALALANVRALGGTMLLANQAEPGVTIVVRLPLPGSNPTPETALHRLRQAR